ncbi:MAG: sigma-70 family RNA polymerase sigma factor [Planctomycetota bacterium]|jgi:RNA polymerase sigma factor (TIGR02999 family)
MSEVTRILAAIEQGDVQAVDELFPLVYQELRQLAAQRFRKELPGQTLQATALVHEAYLRLVGAEEQNWSGRGHFFAAAAEAMRRILIENARRKQRLRHGGGHKRIPLDDAVMAKDNDTSADELIAMDVALEKLAKEDPVKAELVKLRYFAGLTVEQAAEILEISRATAVRYWTYARAWLFDEIKEGDIGTSG